MEYYYSRKMSVPYDDVLGKLTETLQRQGFGIVTTLDLQDIFRQKLGLTFRKYKILGACNPNFAYKAISTESHIGLMIPCNIIVQEHENGEVEVSAIDPRETIGKSSVSPQVTQFADEVSNLLRNAIDDLHRGVSNGHEEALPPAYETKNPQVPMQG